MAYPPTAGWKQDADQHKLMALLPWLLFCLWFGLLASLLGLGLAAGQTSIDFQAYQAGAEAIRRGDSPYLAPEASRQIWLKIHLRTKVVME